MHRGPRIERKSRHIWQGSEGSGDDLGKTGGLRRCPSCTVNGAINTLLVVDLVGQVMPDASEPSFLGYAGTYQERETRHTCLNNDIDAGDLCSALTMAPPCPSRVACEALHVGCSDPRQACGSDAAERNTRCGGIVGTPRQPGEGKGDRVLWLRAEYHGREV